jgi:hypothetical protein
VATAHDARLRGFNDLINAATRMLKVRQSAKEALEKEGEEGEETPVMRERKEQTAAPLP